MVPEIQILSERVDRLSFGYSLTTATLSLQQDHETNKNKEDRFQVTGLKQSGRAAVGVGAQRAAGRLIFDSLLSMIFTVSDRPVLKDVYIPRNQIPAHGTCLPSLVFRFETSIIAQKVRIRLLSHLKTSPALATVWIEPVLTRASHVRVEILGAIRRALTARSIICSVQRFGRSPLLHVNHDHHERVYSFVQACEEFGSQLTPDLLHFAYRSAGRAFNNRLSSTFIVLTDGAQPIPTFTAPLAPVAPLPIPTSANPAAPVPFAPPVRSNYLLQSLAPVVSRKRPNDDSIETAANKRVAPGSSDVTTV